MEAEGKKSVTNKGWLMNWTGPGSNAQKAARGGHFSTHAPWGGGEVGKATEDVGEGKCGAQWALFSLWWRRLGRCTWGERRGWVLGRERSLRIKGEVGKGLLMESKRESVTQERAAESF